MEKTPQKCSFEKHKENNANLYCQECKIYMCNNCEKHHSELFLYHHQYKINKELDEIFTGLCQENNHFYELKYFCKNHNKLCCSECITNFKGKDHGQHTNCNICSIEDIKINKKEKIIENIKTLENLSIHI